MYVIDKFYPAMCDSLRSRRKYGVIFGFLSIGPAEVGLRAASIGWGQRLGHVKPKPVLEARRRKPWMVTWNEGVLA